MALVTRKRKLTERAVRIYILCALYAAFALFVLWLFLFNANYQKIYGCPEVDKATIDFAGVDIPSRDVACNLTGEWEFFYNKWIVTDNENCEPDGFIKMPSLWTYKDFGGGRLPKEGYGSYRLTANNVQSGINAEVYRHYANSAVRMFINGKLTFSSGVLSKNVEETEVTGRTDFSGTVKTDGSPLVIVIEVSANSAGGLNAAPWLAASATGVSYGRELRSINYISLGIACAAVAVSVLSFVFFRYKRDVTVPAFMLVLLAHFLSSKDMLFVFGWRVPASMVSGLITAVVCFVLLIAHFKRNGARLPSPVLWAAAITALLLTLSTFALYGTPLAPVSAYLLLAVGGAFLVPAMLNGRQPLAQSIIYGILFIFLISILFFEIADALGLLVFGTEFIFTVDLMLIIACFTALWLWKMAKAARDAVRVSELECELSSLKNQALKAQIEPHFIFNSLTAIQARYRSGLEEGDASIEKFAKHLRLITDSKEETSVPFDDEVRNVLNYFELENLRSGGKINLLLDLNYTSFCVPVLSLQPLVENAVRHGGLSEKPDGYISLASEKCDNAVIITVSDNGVGFDAEAVLEGVGLSNTRKRFEIAGATLKVESKVNQGTRVTVEIPLE